jgi:hypothetical protein
MTMVDLVDVNWLDSLIETLEQYLLTGKKIEWKDWDGKIIITKVKKELVDIIKENRASLLRMGQQVVREFFSLMGQGRDLAALIKIYNELDNSELILKYKEDTIKLAEIAAQTQQDRAFWRGLAMTVGMRVAFGVIGTLI